MQLRFTAIVTAFLTSTSLAIAQDATPPISATDLLALLQSSEIGVGENDAWLSAGHPDMTIIRDGDYAIYSFPGLDATTDRISLMSHDGRLFYAHYESCSDSETFFKDRTRYLRYLLQSR